MMKISDICAMLLQRSSLWLCCKSNQNAFMSYYTCYCIGHLWWLDSRPCSWPHLDHSQGFRTEEASLWTSTLMAPTPSLPSWVSLMCQHWCSFQHAQVAQKCWERQWPQEQPTGNVEPGAGGEVVSWSVPRWTSLPSVEGHWWDDALVCPQERPWQCTHYVAFLLLFYSVPLSHDTGISLWFKEQHTSPWLSLSERFYPTLLSVWVLSISSKF